MLAKWCAKLEVIKSTEHLYSVTSTLRTSTLQASAANAAIGHHCCCAATFAPNSDKNFNILTTLTFFKVYKLVLQEQAV